MPRIKVIDCPGAAESLEQAITQHLPQKRHLNAAAAALALRKTLSTEGKLRSPDKFRTEGKLPNGKDFYALKTTNAYKLRGYGFFFGDGEFWISHWVYKNYEKLKKEDTARVQENWRRVSNKEVAK